MKTTIGSALVLACIYFTASITSPGSELTMIAIILLIMMFVVAALQQSEIKELKAEIWWLKNPEEKRKQMQAVQELASYEREKSETANEQLEDPI
jgi:hypothetical protein